MRVLVTGGAGFIGSHVVDILINNGHDVAIVDDLSTGKRENINSGAEFYQVKIQSREMASIFREFKPEVINHHAAHIDLRKSVTDPVHDADINIIGSLNLLTLAVKYGVSKMIFCFHRRGSLRRTGKYSSDGANGSQTVVAIRSQQIGC